MKGVLLFVLALAATQGSLRAETGVTDREVRIGVCTPLSGPGIELGTNELDGAKAYIDYVNAELGGVHGRKIKLITYDDKFDMDQVEPCMQRLIQDGVLAMDFGAGAKTGVKYVKLAVQNGIPMLDYGSGIKYLHSPLHANVFRARASYDDETSEEVDHLWNELGLRKMAVIYENNVLGLDPLAGVKAGLEKHNAQPVAVTSIAQDNNPDLVAAINTIKASSPEVVFLPLRYNISSELLKKAHEMSWKPLFILVPGREAMFGLAGQDAMEGAIWALAVPPTEGSLPSSVLFRKAMHKYVPHSVAGSKQIEGFVHAVILVKALEKAGKDPTREGLVKAMESMNDEDIGFGPEYHLHFSPTNHQGYKTLRFAMAHNGKVVAITDWKAAYAKH